MVLILDGNSEIGAHVWSDLGYLIRLICLMHIKQSKIFFLQIRPIFRHACAICSELPSNLSTMILFRISLRHHSNFSMKETNFFQLHLSMVYFSPVLIEDGILDIGAHNVRI